jgi:hypothetical protein
MDKKSVKDNYRKSTVLFKGTVQQDGSGRN